MRRALSRPGSCRAEARPHETPRLLQPRHTREADRRGFPRWAVRLRGQCSMKARAAEKKQRPQTRAGANDAAPRANRPAMRESQLSKREKLPLKGRRSECRSRRSADAAKARAGDI